MKHAAALILAITMLSTGALAAEHSPPECDRGLNAPCAVAEAALASSQQSAFVADADMPAKLARGWLAINMPEKALASLSKTGADTPAYTTGMSRIAAHYWQAGSRQKADGIWKALREQLPKSPPKTCAGNTEATLALWESLTRAQPAWLVQLPPDMPPLLRDAIRHHYVTHEPALRFDIARGLTDILADMRLKTDAILDVAAKQAGVAPDDDLRDWLVANKAIPAVKDFMSTRLPLALAQKGEIESAVTTLHTVDDTGAKSLGWLTLAEYYISIDQKNTAAQMLTFALDLDETLPMVDKPATLALEGGIFEKLGRKEFAADKVLNSAMQLRRLVPQPDTLLASFNRSGAIIFEHWPVGHSLWMDKIWQSSIPVAIGEWQGDMLTRGQQALLAAIRRGHGFVSADQQVNAILNTQKINDSDLREALLTALADNKLIQNPNALNGELFDKAVESLKHQEEDIEACAGYIALARAASAAKDEKRTVTAQNAAETLLEGRIVSRYPQAELESRRHKLRLIYAIHLMEKGQVEKGIGQWQDISPKIALPPRGVDAMLNGQAWKHAWEMLPRKQLAEGIGRTGMLEGLLGYLTVANNSGNLPALFHTFVENKQWDEADRTLKAIRDWDENSWFPWRRVLPRADDSLHADLARLATAKKRPKEAASNIREIKSPPTRAELWLQLALAMSNTPTTDAPLAPDWALKKLCPPTAAVTPPAMPH
ncbi:hypothetical protein GC177_10430 [bacterium]|nr:hypothetical protein [bacterium]